MKKYLLTVLLAVISIGVRAEFNSLVFTSLNGDVKTVSLTDLNITFENGEMTATSADGSVTMALSSLKSMAFGNGASGIESVDAGTAAQGKTAVYATDGVLVGSYASPADAIASLPAGVYIFKADNGATSKIMINR